MTIHLFSNCGEVEKKPWFISWTQFCLSHPESSFFQTFEAFRILEQASEYQPFLFVAMGPQEQPLGSLIGVIQTTGTGLKSWLSRRAIIWGGPLIDPLYDTGLEEIANRMLKRLDDYLADRSIFIEFRNSFDTSPLKGHFEGAGYSFSPHLNFLVKTDDLQSVKKRMSSSRWRQIKSSLKLGAVIAEPENEQELRDFYKILGTLYREKVKKPLPAFDLFAALWKSENARIFLVKYEGKVVGGIACPIFADRAIYEWYVCGEDGETKGLHPSVLATWAPIEYALEKGLPFFDFMGAGKPDKDYGVREFKSRFGGEQVAFGRYLKVVNKPLYKLGKWGMEVYQKIN